MRRIGAKELLVHLVNYNRARTPSISNVAVRLRLPDRSAVKNVTLLTPDRAEQPILPHRAENGLVSFTVPRLATYDLSVIQLE